MYNNNEETFWTNQQLYFYKDKTYNSNGAIEINVSTTTKDYVYFNAATLNFKVSLEGDIKRHKTCSLNISKVLDLFFSIDFTCNGKSPFDNEIIIEKQYSDKKMFIVFKKSNTTNEECVIIRVMNNDSDLVQVIIPYNEFKTIFKILTTFKDDFINITHQLKSHSFNLKQISLLEQMSRDIKTSSNPVNIEVEEIINTNEENNLMDKDTFNQMNELDNFLGGEDITNIDLPELKKDSERATQNEPITKREIDSIFIKDILKGDILKLEELLTSVYSKQDSIDSLFETIKESSNGYYNNMCIMNEDSDKSLNFLSKLIFNSMLRNYLDNNNQIPSTIPTLKYKFNNDLEFNQNNHELVLDLLTIYAYLKTYRNRIESKTDDVESTKSIIYLAFRCFTDWFITSPLENVDKDKYKSNIIERFKYYDSIGFFNNYNEILEKYSLTIVNEHDVSSFVDSFSNSLFENKGKLYINDMHNEWFKLGQIKLPFRNEISKEQIINDIVKIEVACKMDNTINISEFINKMGIDVTDEIKNIYINEKSIKKIDEVKEVKTNLMRYFKDDETFLDIAKTIGNKNFKFEALKINIKDLSDNVIKALFLWKPEGDDKILKNFNYFIKLIEDLSMSKQDIINIVENNMTDVSGENPWDISLEEF